MKKKLLFIVNEPTYFVSHRLPIAIAAREAGYEIHLATGVPVPPQKIKAEGFVYHSIPLSRSGRNIFSELFSLLTIYCLMRRLKPDIVHLVTIKPVIYGALAARIARVPAVVAAVPGLGYAFIEGYFEARLLRQLISILYRHAFRHKNLAVIFQNSDDKSTLLNLRALKENQSIIIRGSGVDLTHYQYSPEPPTSTLVVVMAARLLRDKGIIEYVQAAKYLRQQGVKARFLLAGQIDPGNPSSINQKQLNDWIHAGDIEYIGYCDDTAQLFPQIHLVVLPSYREGLPRVLAEAAACGRAVITTDVPGCREAIVADKTGLLVKVKDSHSLAEAIHKLLINTSLRNTMGIEGRKLAEGEFDITKIVEAHLQIYRRVLGGGPRIAPAVGLCKKSNDSLKNLRIARISTISFSTLTQLRPQLEAINQAGGKITLITSADGFCDELKKLDYCVFKPTYIAREINFFADIVTLFRLWKLFHQQRFDIVHSITPKAGFLCAIAGRLAGVPICLHTYTGQPWVTMHGMKKSIVRWCDQLTSMLTTQCYTDSVSQKNFLVQNGVIRAKKIKVLGSGSLAGIDLARFNPDNFSMTDKQNFKNTLGLQEETFIFLFVGRVTEEKGVYELLESTSHLLAQGYDIVLLIVGPFEKELGRKIPLLASQLCGNKVICTGFSHEPERFMAVADVLCIPSYREGFGTVVIEAAAMGLPSIGTKIYGLSDAVVDGETGILVEPKNVPQLAEAMKNLVDDAPLRRKLGKNAKERAISEFDSKEHGRKLVIDYKNLLEMHQIKPYKNVLEQENI